MGPRAIRMISLIGRAPWALARPAVAPSRSGRSAARVGLNADGGTFSELQECMWEVMEDLFTDLVETGDLAAGTGAGVL